MLAVQGCRAAWWRAGWRSSRLCQSVSPAGEAEPRCGCGAADWPAAGSGRNSPGQSPTSGPGMDVRQAGGFRRTHARATLGQSVDAVISSIYCAQASRCQRSRTSVLASSLHSARNRIQQAHPTRNFLIGNHHHQQRAPNFHSQSNPHHGPANARRLPAGIASSHKHMRLASITVVGPPLPALLPSLANIHIPTRLARRGFLFRRNHSSHPRPLTEPLTRRGPPSATPNSHAVRKCASTTYCLRQPSTTSRRARAEVKTQPAV